MTCLACGSHGREEGDEMSCELKSGQYKVFCLWGEKEKKILVFCLLNYCFVFYELRSAVHLVRSSDRRCKMYSTQEMTIVVSLC
jgi:hypothetical protein